MLEVFKIRILVCGDRNWINKKIIKKRLISLPNNSTIIHGAARGADSIAGLVAKELNFRVEEYPADWENHGRSAGPRRNMKMLKEGRPNLVIAFHKNIEKSKGTKHMLKISKKAGIRTELITGLLQVYTSHSSYKGSDRLDITVKSGDRAFAPTWDLVMSFKKRQISQDEFKDMYYQLMRKSYIQNRPRWDDLLSQSEVTLVCYCPPGQFCHRFVLAEILKKIGAQYKGER